MRHITQYEQHTTLDKFQIEEIKTDKLLGFALTPSDPSLALGFGLFDDGSERELQLRLEQPASQPQTTHC